MFMVAPASPEAVATLREHPAFAEAMRVSARGVVAMYQGSHLLNWLMDDRGRVLLGYMALALQFTNELTPSRVKAMCAELDVCSPGRAGVMLNLMRFGGYLAPATSEDRRVRGLVATDKLFDLLIGRLRLHYTAMTPIFPEAAAARDRLSDRAYVRALVLSLSRRFRAGCRPIMHAPDLGFFGDRSGGILILASLIAAGAADDTVPPTRPVPISVSELARRFAVSRTHVLTMLRDAASEGMIERTGAAGDEIRILPVLALRLQNLFAAIYLLFIDGAREALADYERERAA
jgi:DNA-binding MarR family transcriptional regulator